MLVVAGGYDGSGRRLDTVELLPSLTAPAWQAAPRLPYTVSSASMTAVNGRLLLTGGYDGNYNERAGESWPRDYGTAAQARSSRAHT